MGLARYPRAMLVLFFVGLGVFAVADCLASVAWFDILARAIPVSRRGRLVGAAEIIRGLVGIGVGALVTLILEQRPFASNYALLFTLMPVIRGQGLPISFAWGPWSFVKLIAGGVVSLACVVLLVYRKRRSGQADDAHNQF